LTLESIGFELYQYWFRVEECLMCLLAVTYYDHLDLSKGIGVVTYQVLCMTTGPQPKLTRGFSDFSRVERRRIRSHAVWERGPITW
jgi:hypothetical protein